MNADNASIVSYTSSNTYKDLGSDDINGIDDNGLNGEENGTFVDDFEEKLIEAIDGTNTKSAKTKQLCLDAIRKSLITRFCFDFLIDRFEHMFCYLV